VIAVSELTAKADDEAGVTASFAGTLTNATALNINSTGNDTASTDIHVISIGLAGGAVSTATSIIGGSDLAFIATGSTLESPGTVITIMANQTSEADAGAHGGAGGALGVAVLLATASVTRATKAYVEHDTTVGDNNAKPASLTITAYDASSANSSADCGTGGIASFGGTDAESTVTPTVEAFVGASDNVNLTADLSITATSAHAEGHSRATSFGGGIAQIGAANAHAESDPTVHAFIGASSTVNVGGNVTIEADSHADATGTPLFDYFNADANACLVRFFSDGNSFA